jgi:hypothetical protein
LYQRAFILTILCWPLGGEQEREGAAHFGGIAENAAIAIFITEFPRCVKEKRCAPLGEIAGVGDIGAPMGKHFDHVAEADGSQFKRPLKAVAPR